MDEIKETVEEFAAAAKRAIEAGFDGVEVHGESTPICGLIISSRFLVKGGGRRSDKKRHEKMTTSSSKSMATPTTVQRPMAAPSRTAAASRSK